MREGLSVSSPDITAFPTDSRTTSVSNHSDAAALPLPPVVARLLAASDGAEQDAAWADFVAHHTGLLLHACHALSRERDAVMNGYAFILDALREDDCRRLRAYVPAPGTRFTTWLVVVARLLLFDHH